MSLDPKYTFLDSKDFSSKQFNYTGPGIKNSIFGNSTVFQLYTRLSLILSDDEIIEKIKPSIKEVCLYALFANAYKDNASFKIEPLSLDCFKLVYELEAQLGRDGVMEFIKHMDTTIETKTILMLPTVLTQMMKSE